MFLILLLAFTLIPVAEIAVLIKIGGHIGLFNTIAVIILTGIVGAALAKSQGLAVLFTIKKELAAGRLPADKIFDGVLILIGGLTLLTPGFLTDIAGFSLLIPFLRNIIKKILRAYFKKALDEGRITYRSFSAQEPAAKKNADIIIDAEEVIEEINGDKNKEDF